MFSAVIDNNFGLKGLLGCEEADDIRYRVLSLILTISQSSKPDALARLKYSYCLSQYNKVVNFCCLSYF